LKQQLIYVGQKAYDIVNYKVLNRQEKYVFIMGHMRSGSSLLSHLIMNSSECSGIGESNMTYLDKRDFTKLAIKCRLSSKRYFKKIRYFVDQINHNQKLDFSSFSSNAFIPIIIYRKPLATISSIVRLSNEYYGGNFSPKRATEYYINRLNYLGEYIKHHGVPNICIIEYEDLINNSIVTLSKLSLHLSLQSPLTSKYRTYTHSGTKGDPSANIQKGKIIKTKENLLKLDETLIKQASKAYNRFAQKH